MTSIYLPRITGSCEQGEDKSQRQDVLGNTVGGMDLGAEAHHHVWRRGSTFHFLDARRETEATENVLS